MLDLKPHNVSNAQHGLNLLSNERQSIYNNIGEKLFRDNDYNNKIV